MNVVAISAMNKGFGGEDLWGRGKKKSKIKLLSVDGKSFADCYSDAIVDMYGSGEMEQTEESLWSKKESEYNWLNNQLGFSENIEDVKKD